jgi:antitoxin VapB
MVDMSLNIKNETTHELVRQLAALTGQSQTSAVEDAVRRRLAELEQQRSDDELERRRRIRAVIRRAQQIPSTGRTTEEIMDELYDETGMPR